MQIFQGQCFVTHKQKNTTRY